MSTDYLICGGGVAGCVLAARLKQRNPSLDVTILESGTDEHENPLVTEPMATFQLHESQYCYNYDTAPQKGYNGRKVYNSGGKMLSGSSACNYAMWTRGDSTDYDSWARAVGDDRWNFANQLPYFRKSEHHFDPQADPAVHGFDGPIHTTASTRNYPLREPLKQALASHGLPENPDVNSGNSHGYGTYVENFYQGKRQPAGKAYGLDGVHVRLNSTVRKLLVEPGPDGAVATGVELTDGATVTARKEVILSCGALRSPQVLMLSGIGPAGELSRHDIQQIADLPVGEGLFDHVSVTLFYKLKQPETGYAMGAPAFHMRDPAYNDGMPLDFVAYDRIPRDVLLQALQADGESDSHPLVTHERIATEYILAYAPMAPPRSNIAVPFDGTAVTAACLDLLPTSRGSVTLASTDAAADPIVDPNYYTTHADRAVMRTALRNLMRIIGSPSLQDYIDSQMPVEEGRAPLSVDSTDDEIDAYVQRVAATWYHPAGTCAMGKVVETDLRVKGIRNLRVVDASVFPVPLSAHYQAPTYALAEHAADLIQADA